MTLRDIADVIGCDYRSVANGLDRCEIETRSRAESKSNISVDERLTDCDQLYSEYHEKEKSFYQIAEEVGRSYSTVIKWAGVHGIQARSKSEATELAVESGDKHHSWKGGPPVYGAGWNDTIRESVRDRDDRACRNCGLSDEDHVEKYGGKLQVHHIVPARSIDCADRRNRSSNLLTLCFGCHKKVERFAPLVPSDVAESARGVEDV